jgi:Toastrack DUF4097
MVTSNTVRSVAVTAALSVVVGAMAAAQQPPAPPQAPQPPQGQQARETTTVSFSDPSRPGTLRVNVLTGSVTVRGSNRKDVAIESRGRDSGSGRGRNRPSDPAAAAGLRRLPPGGAGFTLDNEANSISINSSPWRGRLDYEIQVPSRTNLRITATHGSVLVEAVEGELEITSLDGPVTLTNVSGSVVANTHDGDLRAVMTGVTAQKAMAFTSFDGDVDVTLPSSIKANLKLHSADGDVFTNFDLDIKPTPPAAPQGKGRGRVVSNAGTYGLVNGGGVEFQITSFNGNVYVRKGR